MKRILTVFALLGAALPAYATQETFTTAGPIAVLGSNPPLDCSQNTADNLFTLGFVCAYPLSGPTAMGFSVNQPVIVVSNANGGLLDLNSMQISLRGSNFYNGTQYIGAIQLETQDASGNWSYATQWSTSIGASKGIYVAFNGRNLSSPLVRNVHAIRFTAVNGGTMSNIGMLNMTAH